MPILFALTMFVSALLLFLVQPMIGKMVLPLLGGTPAVWNTCMVFYQALLLAGYYYAHKSTSNLAVKKQTTLHAGVMLAAFAVLLIGAAMTANNSPIPIVKSLSPQGDDYPFFGVIVLLLVAIGLPFFVVSTSAPLLQKWFAETGHPSSKDPYFLYAASNFGSLLALIAYPAIVEPNLRLVWQAWVWAVGYGILIVLVFMCARAANQPIAPAKPHGGKTAAQAPKVEEEAPPTFLRQLRWVALGFVPSSLMLGVTTFVSTDMASIPLLWIIPLSLYLITFIIVFSKVPKEVHLTVTLLMPVFVLLLAFLITSRVPAKFGLQLLLHMATFFVVALVCHGELARDRPSTKHLTHFYLLMSVGGMLGGLFNALIAPIVFTFTSEYPITLVAACFLLPNLFPERKASRGTFAFDLIAPAAMFFICCLVQKDQNQIGFYLYRNLSTIVIGLVVYVLASAAVLLISSAQGADQSRNIPLAILLGAGLAAYALGASLFDYLGVGSMARHLRILAPALLMLGYAAYWRKVESPQKVPGILVTDGARLVLCLGVTIVATLIDADIFDTLRERVARFAQPDTVRQIAIYGIPAMVCYFFVERPVRFGAAVAAFWLATFYVEYKEGSNAFYDRSFFGRLKIEPNYRWAPIPADLFPGRILDDHANYEIVADEEDKKTDDGRPYKETNIFFSPKHGSNKATYRVTVEKTDAGERTFYAMRLSNMQLVHGTTVHGQQENLRERRDIATALLPLGSANVLGAQMAITTVAGEAWMFPGRDPQTYYHRTGPVGSMFNAFTAANRAKANPNRTVACIGLGTGSLSAYGEPGQKMVFFEIDTHVRSLVESPRFFTFIDAAKRQGVDIEFAMGDARISLERMDRKFGFMLVDAFSSDAIPAHLLTKEAFQLYLDRLEDDGLLAVHISNRYLDLEPVVDRLCRELKLEARVMHGEADPRLDERRPEYDRFVWDGGKYSSTWIVIAKSKEAMEYFNKDTVAYEREIEVATARYEQAEKRVLTSEDRAFFRERVIRESLSDWRIKPTARDRWIHLKGNQKVGLWTDDFSPIIPILRGEWRFWSKSDD